MVLRVGWNQYTVALHVSKPLHNLNNHSLGRMDDLIWKAIKK